MIGKLYDIDLLLDEVVTLPSMPTALQQVVSLLDNPGASMSEVGRAMSADPAISMKSLRLVNSAYYGLGQEVKTVEHAVVLLGQRVVRNLVVSATVFHAIEGMAERFVRHSVACGVAMRVLTTHTHLSARVSSSDEGFVYGLLHEIGKMLLNEYMQEACVECATLVRHGAYPHLAEQQIIGVDHAAIGARLAERWNLAPEIVFALAGQYEIHRVPVEYRSLAAGLQLANFIAESAGYCSEERMVAQLDPGALAAMDVAPSALPSLLEHFFDARGDIDSMLKLAG